MGSGKMLDNHTIEVRGAGGTEIVEADAILWQSAPTRANCPPRVLTESAS